MAEELKLELPYDHEELPELLALIKTDTQLKNFILQYAQKKGEVLTESDVNVLIADYISSHGLGGSGLSDAQAAAIATIVRNGDGTKVLTDNGTYASLNVAIADYLSTHSIGGSGLTTEQTEKLAKILTNGTGDKFLANDGTYKTVSSTGGTSIDDTTTTATDKTWSASKIKSEIASAIGTAIGGDY